MPAAGIKTGASSAIDSSGFASMGPSPIRQNAQPYRIAQSCFLLRLYSALDSDKLGKTADRRSVFRQPAPRVRHIDQDGPVRSDGGASRQSKAINGVLPIFVASAHDRPLPYYSSGR